MNNNYDFWFWLAVTSNIAQLESYKILLNDFDNTDLMEYLKHQDNLLDEIIEQNKKIISQNKKIIDKLEGENK